MDTSTEINRFVEIIHQTQCLCSMLQSMYQHVTYLSQQCQFEYKCEGPGLDQVTLIQTYDMNIVNETRIRSWAQNHLFYVSAAQL